MKDFLVCFNTGNDIWSSNMIWANTGRDEDKAVHDTAERICRKYGYKEFFQREITRAEAQSNLNKGMPYYSIDEEAEMKYDPSFKED